MSKNNKIFIKINFNIFKEGMKKSIKINKIIKIYKKINIIKKVF